MVTASKIYHIPLDIHVSSAFRDSFDNSRASVGHIHAFSESMALATLRDTDDTIKNVAFTNGAFGLFGQHPSLKRAVANLPRWLISRVSARYVARLLGGYSLLVFAATGPSIRLDSVSSSWRPHGAGPLECGRFGREVAKLIAEFDPAILDARGLTMAHGPERSSSPATASLPAIIRLAFFANRHLPRGRGYVTRLIGRAWTSDNAFIVSKNGALISVDPRNVDVYATIHNCGGVWDAGLMAVTERLLRPRDVFFDIGANVGIISLDAAKAVDNLTVYAFEPQPDLVRHIRRSVEANGFSNFICREVMLGESNARGKLYLSSHAVHASSVPRGNATELARDMRSLDDLFDRGEIKGPDLIKIDVEGGEFDVFEGSRRLLARFQPSILFEADQNLSRVNIDGNSLFEAIRRAGEYRFFKLGAGGSLEPSPSWSSEGNYLALSQKHDERLPAM